MSEIKNIPIGWMKTTLGEVADIGSSKRIFFSDYVSEGVPFYRSKEIIEKQKGNNISLDLFITEERFQEIDNQFGSPKKNDLLLTSVGTLGIPYLVKKDERFYFKDGNLTWFKNYKKIEPLFLYNWLLSSIGIESLKNITIGSTQSALTIGGLRTIPILLPTLPEQKLIASILTVFDNKIELLQAQNKTLEETALTIFTEWFGKYQINDELPEGWRITKVNEFIDSSLGGDYGKEDIEDDYDQKTLCLRGTDLPDMKMGTPEKAPIRYLKKSKLDRCQLINGDIVIEISGGTENQSTGRVMYINDIILKNSKLPMTCVNFCRIIRPLDIKYSYFLHSLFDYLYKRKVFFNWENGTTGIKNLNLNAFLEGFKLLVPNNQNKIVEFNKLVESSFIKIQTNNTQIQTLTKTRDELLPRLMSGELRVNKFK